MMVRNVIIEKIKGNVLVSVPINEKSNLYTDLGFDSLSFITLLTEIEDAYSITFDISEMETCLQVGRLIKTVQKKIKEREMGND